MKKQIIKIFVLSIVFMFFMFGIVYAKNDLKKDNAGYSYSNKIGNDEVFLYYYYLVDNSSSSSSQSVKLTLYGPSTNGIKAVSSKYYHAVGKLVINDSVPAGSKRVYLFEPGTCINGSREASRLYYMDESGNVYNMAVIASSVYVYTSASSCMRNVGTQTYSEKNIKKPTTAISSMTSGKWTSFSSSSQSATLNNGFGSFKMHDACAFSAHYSQSYKVASGFSGSYSIIQNSTSNTNVLKNEFGDNNGIPLGACRIEYVQNASMTLSSDAEIKQGSSGTISYTYNGDGTLSITSSDNSIATASITSNNQITINGVGVGKAILTLSATGTDNYNAVSKTCEVTVTDSKPPEGTLWASTNLTNQNTVTIYVSASDNSSGVRNIIINGWYGTGWVAYCTGKEATYDSGNNRWYAEFSFNELVNTSTNVANQGDGTYTFDAHIYDNVDNHGYASASSVTLDRTGPWINSSSVTGATESNGIYYTNNTTGEITINYSEMGDNLSGLSHFDYYLKKDGGARTSGYNVGQSITGTTGYVKYKLNGEGTYKTEIYIYDKAWNCSACSEITIICDSSGPWINSSSVTGATKSNGIYYTNNTTGEITINYSEMGDNLSGLSHFDYYLKKDGGARTYAYNVGQSITGTTGYVKYKLNGEGTYKTEIYIYDKAWNCSACSEITIICDSTPPTQTVVDFHGYTLDTWTNQNVNRTFNATDNLSGIAYYQWSSDGVNVGGNEPSNSVPITWDGINIAYHRAVDKAGNIGAWSTRNVVKRDTVAPEGSISASSTNTTNSSVKISVTASDDRSGVKNVVVCGFYGSNTGNYWSTHNATYNSSTGKYEVTINFADVPNRQTGANNQGNGTYHFDAHVYDNANNEVYISPVDVVYIATSILTINPNGGLYKGTTSNTTIQSPVNNTIIIPAPIRNGYKFTGWTLSGSGRLNPQNMYYITPQGDVTLSVNSNNDLVQNATNVDPRWDIATSFSASTIKKVRLTLDNNTSSTALQIFFTTTGTSISEDKSVWANMASNQTDQIVTVDFSSNTKWTGIVETLRFDIGTTTGNSVIKKIEFLDSSNNVYFIMDNFNEKGYSFTYGSSDATLTANWVAANYSVNGNYYATLASANASITSSGTIKVERNVTDNTAVSIASGRNVTLDLNGKTITVNGKSSGGFITNYGTLTIKDSSFGGKISMSHSSASDSLFVIYNSNGTLNINSGTLTLASTTNWPSTVASNGGTVNMNGGTVAITQGSTNGWGVAIFPHRGATLNIKGGTINSIGSGVINQSDGAGIINMTSGTINSSYIGVQLVSHISGGSTASKFTMTGGTINANDYGVYNDYATGGITISGGTIVSSSGAGVKNSVGTLNIGASGGGVSTTSPSISGATYGVEGSNGFNFYDGILKGVTAAYSGTVSAMESGYAIYNGTETINSSTYKIAYLKEQITEATLSQTTYTYTGSACTPTATVKAGTTTLTLNTDYTVEYSNNINVGTATVTITGKGNYVGTITKTFTINKASGYVNLSATSDTIIYGTASKTFTVSSHHGGTLSVAETTSTAAEVSISGTTVTIGTLGGLATGTKITVRVTSAATATHNSAYKDYTLTIINLSALLMQREDVNYIIGAKRANKLQYTGDTVKTITLIDLTNTSAPTTYVDTWDVSINSDGNVTAWIVTNSEDSTMYDLYIGGKAEIIAPEISYNLFSNYKKCTVINGINNLNTSNVKDMSYMFTENRGLTSLDLTEFKTNNVTNMSFMFYYCTSLTSLNVSSFDTTNVTNMRNMFNACSNLTSLDVTNFSTSNVTNMGNMFTKCSELAALDLTKFDTSKVGYMNGMFESCTSLSTLDLSNFNTSQVKTMEAMFNICTGLTSLDVSNFNTSNVTDMNCMFKSCRNLTSLDLRNFNTSKVTDFSGMFDSCYNLNSIDLSNFDTSSAKVCVNMFGNCISLTSLDLSSFDLSNLGGTNWRYINGSTGNYYVDNDLMFSGCKAMKSILLGNLFTRIDGENIFDGCTSLTAIITQRSITDATNAMLLSTNTGVSNTTVLYVPNVTSKTNYETATNYDTVFGADRIRPILELIGENPVKVALRGTYVDDYVTVAGFFNGNSNEYTQYGYAVATSGLPVDTSTTGTKQVTYTLNYTDNKLAPATTSTVMTVTRDVVVNEGPVLMEENYTNANTNKYILGNSTITQRRADVLTITIQDSQTAPEGAIATWDVSKDGNGTVTAWLVPNATDSTKYDLYIGGEGGVIASSGSYLFYGYTNCTAINGLDKLDTSSVTDMRSMFRGCNSLTSIDVTNFDTSSVTSMVEMFSYCSSLTSLDVTNFDTSSVTDMSHMFYNCNKLTSLDVTNFNTSKVTNMSFMFSHCSSLTSLDVTNFDTSSVTNMSETFSDCRSLTSIDVTNFDTSSVTKMEFMFSDCNSLTSLDVSNFDTSSVRTMQCMFQGCSSLPSLYVTNFDTSSVTNMSNMFASCSKLPSLDVTNFNTSSVKNMSYMFYACNKLASLDVTNFNTSSVTDMSYMFNSCSSLPSLDVTNFNTSSVKNMSYMFYACNKLASLDVTNFNTSSATDMSYMFYGCSSLTSLDLTSFNTSSVTDMSRMFHSCSKLKSIALGTDFDKLNGSSILNGTTALTSIITQRSTPMTLSANTGVGSSVILYVPDTTAEAEFESGENYDTVFGADRIRPILELIGENPAEVLVGATYVDDYVTVAGFFNGNSNEYTQYGYNVTTTGLPVDTSTLGTKQVTYTLKDKTNTVVMEVTRTVNVLIGNYSVDGVYFQTLEEAYSAITGTSGTIKVEQDNTDSSIFTVESGKTITLNTNGKNITKRQTELVVNSGGTLKIIGTGTITTESAADNTAIVELINNKGTLEIDEATLIHQGRTNGQWFVVYGNGTVNLKGGTLKSTLTDGVISSYNPMTININSGTLNMTGGTVICDITSGIAIQSWVNGTGSINISEGTVRSENGTAIYCGASSDSSCGTNVIVTGGTIEGIGGEGIAFNSYCTGNIEIRGGTVRSTTNCVAQNGTGKVIIGEKGGSVSKTSPVLQAGTYGVNASNEFEFYDGILKGVTASYDGTVSEVESGYAIYSGTETIDSVTYKTAYLKKSITSVTLSQTTYTYDGNAKTPTTTVKAGDTTLTLNTDYTVAYSNNTNVGTAIVTITGIGSYIGTLTTTFTINKASGYVNLSATSDTIIYGTASKTFTVSSHHGGTLSVAETTSTAAEPSISGTTVTIGTLGGLATGTKVTVRVTSAATATHNSAYKDYTLTVSDATIGGSIKITGTNTYGQTLTADTSSVTPTGCTFTYQWWYSSTAGATSGTNISGATSATLKLSDKTYIGKYMGVTVVASKTNYKTETFIDSSTVEVYSLPEITSVRINDGASRTKNIEVIVEVNATDTKYMYISNTNIAPNDSDWVEYTKYSKHSLITGNGTKSIYVWCKDEVGNIVGPKTASIVLDASFTLTLTNRQVYTGNYTYSVKYAIKTEGGTYAWQDSNVFKGLKPNTVYYVKTRIEDTAGMSEESKEVKLKAVYNSSGVLVLENN